MNTPEGNQTRFADLRSKALDLVERRKRLEVQVRSLSADFSEEGALSILRDRRVTVIETGQLIHQLWPELENLEAINFERAASLKRTLNKFVLRQRPMERTEFDWETDRIIDLTALLREFQNPALWSPQEAKAPRTNSKALSPDFSPILAPDGSTWADVLIAFPSDHEIRVTIGGVAWPRDYERAGFQDLRTGKSNTAWAMLSRFAKDSSVARPFPSKEINMVEKGIQELRKRLRRLLSIDADPIRWNRSDRTYRPNFKTSILRDLDS